MLAETTITIPTNFSMPEFQPLWAWITAAVSLWYATVALLMRLTGRGPRIWHDYAKYEAEQKELNKTRMDENQKHPFPPGAAVLGRLLVSPLEFLCWCPIKYATLIAFSPLFALTWVAKGTKPERKMPTGSMGYDSPADVIRNLSKMKADAFSETPKGV